MYATSLASNGRQSNNKKGNYLIDTDSIVGSGFWSNFLLIPSFLINDGQVELAVACEIAEEKVYGLSRMRICFHLGFLRFCVQHQHFHTKCAQVEGPLAERTLCFKFIILQLLTNCILDVQANTC